MSNIYIQEPPALGKVLLKTSVGDIDLELWTKEAPKACRNFIQLCMEGYYNGTIFHRVVPDFIVQGGDPKGDGTGGESVFGGTFKDEFHSRLRFNRRGLVAMANAGKDDNGSQFFFTLNATPELQNKHTIFAKVTGETVFNMIKLAEGLTDQDDRPLYPHKIISSQVLVDPFGDIVPRVSDKAKDSEEGGKKKKKRDKTGVKNFGLLSFGVEAEEEEDQSTEFRGKPKSTHDVLDDPKLSRLTALEVENDDEGAGSSNKVMDEATVAAVNSIRDKLQAKSKGDPKKGSREIDRKTQDKLEEKSEEEEVEEYYLGKDRIEARKKQAEEIRGQIRDLKREMSGKKASDIEAAKAAEEKADEKKPDNELIQDFEQQQEKYKKMKEDVPKKGVSREQFTLALLSKFKKKLSSMKEKVHEEKEGDEESAAKKPKVPVDDLEAINSDNWLTHELHFENHGQVLAKDASTKGDDWFDIYDPRNPLNKRKREQSSKEGPQSSKTRKNI